MPNVTIFTVGPLVDSFGGVEKVSCVLANELFRRHFNVTLLCADPHLGRPAFPLEEGICFHNACASPVPFLLHPILLKFRSFDLSKSQRRKNRYKLTSQRMFSRLDINGALSNTDIILAQEPESVLMLQRFHEVGLIPRKPIIMSIHLPADFFYVCLNTNQSLFSFIKHTVLLRPEYVETFNRIPCHKNITVIPNAVFQQKLTVDYSNPILINVARFSTEKRLDLLIQSFALLKELYPAWNMELWGNHADNTYLKETKKLIQSLGISERIGIMGTTSHVADQLRRASIFAFPSAIEGFPLAMTEAMAMGLPVIACKDCTGVNTLIRDGENGILTDPTPEAFAHGLSKLMSDQTLRERLGRQAKEDMRSFSPEKIFDQWESLIRESINEPSS